MSSPGTLPNHMTVERVRAFNGTEPELMHDEPNRFVRVTFHLAAGGSGA